MQQINLLNKIKMKENQNINNNDMYENRENNKSIYTCKRIILIFITVIVGLGFIAAIILISIEFNQIHRLSQEASAIALQTSNSMNLTLFSTIKQTNHTTSTYISSSTIVSTIASITTTTTFTPSTTMLTTTTTTTIVTTTNRSILLNTTTTFNTSRDLTVIAN